MFVPSNEILSYKKALPCEEPFLYDLSNRRDNRIQLCAGHILYSSPFYLFCRSVLRMPAVDFSSTSKK